jgi:hypothetical protein
MSKITVALGLQAEAFRSGMEKARGYAKEFGTSLTGSIFKGVTAAQLADKTIGFLTNTFKEYADLADTAAGLGVNVEELQKLGAVAQQVGISMGQTGQILRRVNQLLAKGMSDPKYAEKLAKLGLTQEQIRTTGFSATDAIIAMARATDGAADPMQKMAVLMEFMDARMARSFIPLLVQGSAEMERMAKAAPAASAGLVKQFDALDDQLTVAQQWLKVVGAVILSILVRVGAVFTSIGTIAFGIGSAIGTVIGAVVVGIGFVMGLIGDLFAMLTGDFDFSNWEQAKQYFREWASSVSGWFSGIWDFLVSQKDVVVSGTGLETGGGEGGTLNKAKAADALEKIDEAGATGTIAKSFVGSQLASMGGAAGVTAVSSMSVDRQQLAALQTIASNTASTSDNTRETKDAPAIK